MLGVARCPWVGVQPRSRLDPGSMDLFQHLLHLGDQSTAGLWGAGGHHARSEPPETLECFGGHLYLLLCGWVFGVLMGPASLSPHWLPQTPPLGSSQALWHCQKIPSRHPAVMETQRLLLWASPTWHKGALVFVITGVAMATAHRYKPCPGDIVIGEQGAAQEPVLLYWHDLSLWPVQVSGVYPLSCFCRKSPYDRALSACSNNILHLYWALCIPSAIQTHSSYLFISWQLPAVLSWFDPSLTGFSTVELLPD